MEPCSPKEACLPGGCDIRNYQLLLATTHQVTTVGSGLAKHDQLVIMGKCGRFASALCVRRFDRICLPFRPLVSRLSDETLSVAGAC